MTEEAPNYVRKVAEMLKQAVRAGRIPKGGTAMIDVLHEDHCDMIQHDGRCNCDPTVKILPNPKLN